MERGLRTRELGGATLALALAALVVVPTVIAGPGDTTLVSRESRAAGGQGADDESYDADLSASGRFVAFRTGATNLGGPIQAPVNIYVYDRTRKRVELISRESRAAGGQGANASSFQPSISGDGRFVAFRTGAVNLGGPIQTASNIYVYDRERDRVTLVSRQSRSAGGQGVDQTAEDPAISGNGRVVSFQTPATNLGGPLNTAINFYAYDREAKRVELVSRQSRSAGGQGQNDAFFDDSGSAISHSGRFVAFMTPATNLGGPIAPGGVDNIYVYDRKRDQVQLVSRRSRSAGGQGSNGGSDAPSLSASGRFVAFETGGQNLGGPVGANQNVYVYDRERKRVALVSRQGRGAGGAGGDALSYDPSISGSGRFVAMTSNAQNLGGNPAVITNVYVYDGERKRMRLVSRQSPALGGAAADEFSDNASIAAGGRFIGFDTNANNLGGPIDPTVFSNIYVHQRPGR